MNKKTGEALNAQSSHEAQTGHGAQSGHAVAANQIHQRFLTIAPTLSDHLTYALTQNGAIALRPNQTVPFPERLCRTIAGQQLSVKAAAQSIWKRVLTHAGDMPLIQHFATAKADILRSCGLSGAKAKAIIGIAHAAQAGQLDKTDLAHLGITERTQRLTQLWGVGQSKRAKQQPTSPRIVPTWHCTCGTTSITVNHCNHGQQWPRCS